MPTAIAASNTGMLPDGCWPAYFRLYVPELVNVGREGKVRCSGAPAVHLALLLCLITRWLSLGKHQASLYVFMSRRCVRDLEVCLELPCKVCLWFLTFANAETGSVGQPVLPVWQQGYIR